MNGARARAARFKPTTLDDRTKSPLVLLLFILTICMPPTIAFYLGNFLITPYRILVIALAPVLLIRLSRVAKNESILPDLFIVFFGFWTVVCFNLNLENPIERSGQFFLETIFAYLVGRIYVRNITTLLSVIKLMMIIAFVALALAIPEAVTRQKFILDWTSAITGVPYTDYALGTDVRLGLRRPQVFFSNPILFGLFCSLLLPFVWYFSRTLLGRTWRTIGLLLATAISLSTAPLLALNVQVVMVTVESLTRGLKKRWTYILGGTAILMAIVNTVAKGGVIGVLLNYLTFNLVSSYNRVHIWNWGWYNIGQNPLFGLDTNYWVRPRFMKVSIDNFWIFITMQGGLPALIFLCTAIGLITWRLSKLDLDKLPARFSKARTAWFFSFYALAFSGFSVMFFGAMQPLFFFMLGIGAGVAQGFGKVTAAARPKRRKPTGATSYAPQPALA